MRPPQLPVSLYADIAGGERAAFAALALLAERERTGRGGTARSRWRTPRLALAAPLRAGLTADGAVLGGANPFYAVYPAQTGFVAVGCLEPQFADRLAEGSVRARPTSSRRPSASGRRTTGSSGPAPTTSRSTPCGSYAPTPARNRVRQPSQQK